MWIPLLKVKMQRAGNNHQIFPPKLLAVLTLSECIKLLSCKNAEGATKIEFSCQFTQCYVVESFSRSANLPHE